MTGRPSAAAASKTGANAGASSGSTPTVERDVGAGQAQRRGALELGHGGVGRLPGQRRHRREAGVAAGLGQLVVARARDRDRLRGRELLHARRDHAEHRRVDPRRLRPLPGRLEVDGRPPQRERDPVVPVDDQVAVLPGQAGDVLAALQRLAQRRGHVVHVGIDPLPHRTKSSTAALNAAGTSK